MQPRRFTLQVVHFGPRERPPEVDVPERAREVVRIAVCTCSLVTIWILAGLDLPALAANTEGSAREYFASIAALVCDTLNRLPGGICPY